MRFKELSAYSGLAYLNQFANVLLNLLFIKSLSLHTLGEIAIAKVWMQVMDYSHLGLRFSLDRYVPVWDRQRSAHLLWICIGVSSLVSVVIIGVALLFTENKLLILIFCAWGYGIAIATILKSYYRASAELKQMLTTYVVCPTIPIVGQAASFYFWGFNSFLAVTAFTSLTVTLYLLTKVRSTAADAWRHLYASLSSVRSTAAALFIYSIVVFLAFSVDRIILNGYSSKELVGKYSIILFAFAMLLIIPSTLAEFIFPKIIRTTIDDGRKFYPREILAILCPTAAAVMVAYLSAPYLLSKFTRYGDLVEQIQLITLGILPYAVTPILYHVMNALNLRVQLVLSTCALLCIYMLALFWGGIHSASKLEFFTLARVLYGYGLLSVYWLCLALHRRRLS